MPTSSRDTVEPSKEHFEEFLNPLQAQVLEASITSATAVKIAWLEASITRSGVDEICPEMLEALGAFWVTWLMDLHGRGRKSTSGKPGRAACVFPLYGYFSAHLGEEIPSGQI